MPVTVAEKALEDEKEYFYDTRLFRTDYTILISNYSLFDRRAFTISRYAWLRNILAILLMPLPLHPSQTPGKRRKMPLSDY